MAKINVPPKGFLIATAFKQSKGKLETLQITGWTFCCKFSEMAAMAHVSLLTATRLKQLVKVCSVAKCVFDQSQNNTYPAKVLSGSYKISSVGS